jgi:hypothetical protein
VGVFGLIVFACSLVVPKLSVSLASSSLQPCRNVHTNPSHSASDTLGRPNVSAALLGCLQNKAVRDEVSVVRSVNTAVSVPEPRIAPWTCLLDGYIFPSEKFLSNLLSLAGTSGAIFGVPVGGGMREESRFVIATWRFCIWVSCWFCTKRFDECIL